MRMFLGAALIAVVALAGCSASPQPLPMPSPSPTSTAEGFVVPDELLADVPVSDDCLEHMRLAQGRVDSTAEVKAMFQAVLDACTTPEEWVSAFRIAIAEVDPPNPAARNEFGALVVTCLNAMDMGIQSATCDAVELAGWLENLPADDSTVPGPHPRSSG